MMRFLLRDLVHARCWGTPTQNQISKQYQDHNKNVSQKLFPNYGVFLKNYLKMSSVGGIDAVRVKVAVSI
jgi:hypothetical protein